MRSTGICCSCSAPAGVTPSRLSRTSAASMARAGSSAVTAVSASVLMMMARWNRPFAAGMPSASRFCRRRPTGRKS